MNQPNRRKADLLLWLTNFYDYEILEGNPIRIHIKQIYGEYKPMPRKVSNQKEEKIDDYTNFTIASLGTEYKPNSKTRIARNAINEFGQEKYGHTSSRAVADRFIKKPFNEYGETNGVSVWVFYETYEPLTDDLVSEWRQFLEEEHMSEVEAAKAFYKYADGEDVSQEISYYRCAQKRFREKYGDFPVYVKNWKLKIEKARELGLE